MNALEIKASVKGQTLGLSFTGSLTAAGLTTVRAHVASELARTESLAAVLDLRKVRPRFTSQQWQTFVLTSPGAEVPWSTPIALVVQKKYLAAGDAYSIIWARTGRLRCFFTEPDEAFSWAAWRLIRPSIVSERARTLPEP